MSSEALKRFADGTFDWLYIDGNHAYAYVCEDLGWAFRKVRAGGFIAGDDYNWGAADAFPVRRALDEFVERHALHDRVEILGSQFILQKR
jgi:predicted O-methyltransferase YrrM